MELKEIISKEASPALGPYCHGRKYGSMIITSGQIPLTKEGEYIYEVKAATKLVLKNLISIVEAGGGSKNSVARVDIFVNSLDDFSAINETYAEFFGDYKPTRVCVQVEALPADVPLEASMLAFAEE
ncbi:reactive intermediate/imine deaminase [Lactonifactor longoviformis]|uniref:2-iminobutanoate/2-iminopropanoate deaminase n=1 Tax=Lactonifactor longoviformis DSM 17459 TaxID=1122155 RepID=A0A1M4Z1F2_9CLOT|nr:Rid family detoxifying hydrolase [Lactonifactor longoviformis]POP35025.1 reactive intermediate/imine deaminase [Lactonifactor longoviformis]SHF11795.1 2-iminobutanoate/2-iminopropanoate deaminase [Lactonifactor longoviformis DSM 17459]